MTSELFARIEMAPRDPILGVTEADVIASLDAGELKGKKIGSAWRITKTALDAFLAE
jgi:excisionase family DNA binding protein